MQLWPDGGVHTLNLLDAGLLPYTRINGSTFPAPDPAVIGATPDAQRSGLRDQDRPVRPGPGPGYV